MNKDRGFTLIELIITMMVAAIVLTVGVPSFRDVIKNNRITAQTNEFLAAVNFARSEAVKRGEPMTLCAQKNWDECEEDEVKKTDWSIGLILMDASDTVIRQWDPISASTTFVADSGFLQYLGTGSLSGAAVNFALEVYKCTGHQKRTVTLSRQGHATVQTTTCTST